MSLFVIYLVENSTVSVNQITCKPILVLFLHVKSVLWSWEIDSLSALFANKKRKQKLKGEPPFWCSTPRKQKVTFHIWQFPEEKTHNISKLCVIKGDWNRASNNPELALSPSGSLSYQRTLHHAESIPTSFFILETKQRIALACDKSWHTNLQSSQKLNFIY